MRRSLLPWLARLFVVAALALPGLRSVAAQDESNVVGNSYTSPTFGYGLTWDDTWLVLEETSDETGDSLVLTNGPAFVSLFGFEDGSGDPQDCLNSIVSFIAQSEDFQDVEPIEDEDGRPIRGEDDTRAFAVYTVTITTDGGDELDIARHLECRTLIPGEAILFISGETLIADYETQAPLIDDLLSGLVLNAAGESGPVFAPGPWRLAVVAAARDRAIADAELDRSSGDEWVLVVADVTNWSDDDATLDLGDVALRLEGEDDPVPLAEEETEIAAEALDTEPASVDDGLELAGAETARVTLVFQIPDDGEEPALLHEETALPLADALDAEVDLDNLPNVVPPPALEEAEVVSVRDGRTLTVILASDDEEEEQTVQLIGVDSPVRNECYADEAAVELTDLAGDTVFLEQDGNASSTRNLARFVWAEERDGSKTLLNRQLINGGFAALANASEGTRFHAWLSEEERVAQDEETGLWGACTGPHGDAQSGDDDTPATDEEEDGESPTAEPEAPPPDDDEDDGTARFPAHIHEGSCNSLPDEAAFELADVREGALGARGGARSVTTLDASIAELTTGDYAIDVHDADGEVIACGQIRDESTFLRNPTTATEWGTAELGDAESGGTIVTITRSQPVS